MPPLAVRLAADSPAVTLESVSVPDAPRKRTARAPARVATAAIPAYLPGPDMADQPEPPAVEEIVRQEPVALAEPEPIVVATAPASTLATDARPLPAFPRRGRITFNLVYGRDQFPVGQTVQTWEIDGNRYLLASRSETSGIVDLIRSQHRTYSSRGALTADGLRPETFEMSRNRGRGPEEAQARFDWASGSLTLGSP